MKKLVLFIIRAYQKSNPFRISISRALFGTNYTCRFSPTCSDYMYGSVKKHGALRGITLGARRIIRCHPFSKQFGLDPVK